MALLLLTAVAHAQPTPTPTPFFEQQAPDGRAGAALSGGFSGSSGFVGARGRIGAFGFDHKIEGAFANQDSYLRVTNPPMNGAIELSQNGGQQYDELFGPPIARATVGTGGITAGFDEAGRLTVLGWPGPGLYDHVNYLNISRGLPNKGAPGNGGAFAGFGSEWLLPQFGWQTVSQGYASDETQTLVTVLSKGGLTVTVTDVVHPTLDLVARNFRFACTAIACQLPASLIHYANMNPTTTRHPRIPSVHDALLDNVSDFATLHDGTSSTMLHFRPYKVDPASASRLATSRPDPVTASDAVAGSFGPGIYVAIGGQQPASSFQAGLESAGLVRDEAQGSPLIDPYYDLSDGALSGSPVAFGKTAGAIAIPPDGDGSFTVYFSAGESPSEAIALIGEARSEGFDKIRKASDKWWKNWIRKARLPATTDAQTLAVARHALMLIRTAQDRKTGAIVANATPQTPYRQDWVRDGAFFNYALLLAGYEDMVFHHSDFYLGISRPGGFWDTLYYTDGAEAGLVFPYEIDSQAFALWGLWLPYEFTKDAAYLAKVYPLIRETANALLLCQDPTNGMQCYAAEDDAVVPTQGAQGAATVYLALSSAVKAAEALGPDTDPDLRALWSARATDVRRAAVEQLCTAAGCQGGRGGVYLVWPSRLLIDAAAAGEIDPVWVTAHLNGYSEELDDRAGFLSPEAPAGFFQYPMEPVFGLSISETRAAYEPELGGWIRWLTHDVPEPGVLHYGERIFHCDGGGPFCEPGRRYFHSIGFPHIWSGTETYIASAFVHGLRKGPKCPNGQKIGEAVCKPLP